MTTLALQALRTERALQQAPEYRFRLVRVNTTLGPVHVVNVTSPQGAIYTVRKRRCNCPDFLKRCARREGLICKHVQMVDEWMARHEL